jgi:hypothetical protein
LKFSSFISGNQSRPLKYYCMSCGKEHNEIACPFAALNEESRLDYK